MRPLHQFLSQDLEEVKASKKAYYKAHSEALQVTDKFGQVRGGKGMGGEGRGGEGRGVVGGREGEGRGGMGGEGRGGREEWGKEGGREGEREGDHPWPNTGRRPNKIHYGTLSWCSSGPFNLAPTQPG